MSVQTSHHPQTLSLAQRNKPPMSLATSIPRSPEAPPAFFFSCRYRLGAEARNEIETRFLDKLQRKGMSAELEYDLESDQFIVTNLSASIPTVYEVFQKVVDDFILEALGDDSEYGDAEGEGLSKFRPVIAGEEDRDAGQYESVVIQSPGKAKWSCPDIERLGDHVFHEKLLNEIGRLCDCTLQFSTPKQISIVGSTEEDCARAIQKLDRIRDNDTPLFNNPRINDANIFWAEEEVHFAPVILPLKAIHTLYETTLIDVAKYDYGNCYQELAKGGTIRCSVYFPAARRFRAIPAKQPEPAVEAAKKSDKCKLFGKYKYSGKEDGTDPMKGIDPADAYDPSSAPAWIPAEKKTQVEQWVRDLPEYSNADVKHEGGDDAQLISLSNNEPKTDLNADMSTLQRVGLLDVDLGALESPSLSQPMSPSGPGDTLIDIGPADSKHQAKGNAIPQSSSLSQLMSPAGPADTLIDIGPADEKPQKNVETDDKGHQATMKHEASRDRWDLNRLAPAHTPSPTPPAHSVATPHMSKDFVDQLEVSVHNIMDTMRSWPGEVKLVAQFGRLWVNRHTHRQLASDSAHIPWADTTKLSRKLLELDSGRPIVEMTNFITTLPADIQHLAGMGMLGASPYWNPRPSWSISYQFQCQDLNPSSPVFLNDKFLLDVDAESFAYKVHTLPQSLGDCHVHCLKRNWDYRLSGTGTKNLSEEYGSFAENLVKTLYIPADTDDASLWMSFQLDSHHLFAFHTVRVAKKHSYTSFDGKSRLNITEYRDMNIKLYDAPARGSSSRVYKVWAQQARDSITYKECSWFEVSVSCPKAEELFEQNKAMEVGEESAWMRRDLEVAGVIPALYGPACAMVGGMDGVGFYNENPFGPFLRAKERGGK